jgi:membrane protein
LKISGVLWQSIKDFFRDGGLMLAGSMSYFMMMAIVPFCLFIVTLIGYFLGEYPELYDFFVKRVSNLFPSITDDVTQEILKLIRYRGIGKFTLLLYGLLSYQLFASLETSMNVIFKVSKKRRFIFSLLISLAVVTLVVALLVISFVAASLMPFLAGLKTYFPSLRIGLVSGFAISYIMPFLLVLVAAATVYIFFPRAKVSLRHALKGAFFTALFLEIAKHVFTWYIGEIAPLGRIYGPLSAFVVFLLWMFYSSGILLIGAEIVHNLQTGKKS